MEEQTKRRRGSCPPSECASACGACSCAGWYCPSQFHILRWILGVVIISFVFWCGMKIGELKAELLDLRPARALMGHYDLGYPANRMMYIRTIEEKPDAPGPAKKETDKSTQN